MRAGEQWSVAGAGCHSPGDVPKWNLTGLWALRITQGQVICGERLVRPTRGCVDDTIGTKDKPHVTAVASAAPWSGGYPRAIWVWWAHSGCTRSGDAPVGRSVVEFSFLGPPASSLSVPPPTSSRPCTSASHSTSATGDVPGAPAGAAGTTNMAFAYWRPLQGHRGERCGNHRPTDTSAALDVAPRDCDVRPRNPHSPIAITARRTRWCCCLSRRALYKIINTAPAQKSGSDHQPADRRAARRSAWVHSERQRDLERAHTVHAGG